MSHDSPVLSPAGACLHELVEWAAQRYPDALAVAGPDGSFTYREMNRQADDLAARLVAAGVGPDDLVGLCLGRSAGTIVAMLGILKAGGAYVCLDPALPLDRLRFMAADAGLRAAVGDSQVAGALELDCPVIAEPASEATAPASRHAPVTAQHAAYVMYTSGSEGEPKGVVVEHRSVVNLIRWQVRTFGISATDRAAEVSSLTFDASILEIWPYLATGASVHIARESVRPFPKALRRWLIEDGITTAWLTSPLAEQLMELGMPADGPFRLLVTGGDRLHTRPSRDFSATVINVYGPTETTVITTAGRVEPDAEGLPTIGVPIDNVHLHLLDEDGMPVPDGEPGEVFIGGAGVSRGYLHRDDLTRQRFVPDRFCAGAEHSGRLYRTGDIACHLADGRYAFVGRRDGQVKVRGYRIELGEVETVLAAGPGVAQAVVVPRGSRTGRHLVAYVQPAGASFDATQARQHLAQKLPYYMVPEAFHVVADFPLTPNGKIDRAALAAEGGGR